MNNQFKTPPKSPQELSNTTTLKERLSGLIGNSFVLTGKPRTDGSNIRKLIADTLLNFPLPVPSVEGSYEIVPPKKKGVPKNLREFIDTYIVTSGKSYNLQVWNRIPASDTLLVKYESGESLKCSDVRFIFTKVDVENQVISAIVIASPKYLVEKFGKFGKQTVKHQLLISSKIRTAICSGDNNVMLYNDTSSVLEKALLEYKKPTVKMTKEPNASEVFAISLIKNLVADKLIGFKLEAADTKSRGQALERKVLELLGYSTSEVDLLHGGFPDIPNQMLEPKLSDYGIRGGLSFGRFVFSWIFSFKVTDLGT